LTVFLPPFLAEFPVYGYKFSLDQILVKGFSLFTPEDDVKKTCLIYPLIAAFLPPVSCYRELAYRGTAGSKF
jgi:hypothetical protein